MFDQFGRVPCEEEDSARGVGFVGGDVLRGPGVGHVGETRGTDDERYQEIG